MAVYAIRVIGQVDAHWSVWFDGLTISNASPGEAMIYGEIADQAALHGALCYDERLPTTLRSNLVRTANRDAAPRRHIQGASEA